MISKINFSQPVKSLLCFTTLFFIASCSKSEADVKPETTVIHTNESTTTTTTETFEAPGSIVAFSSSLTKCKLQTDYLSSDVTNLSAYASYFFYLSSSKMILSNDGGSSTRTELRRTDNFDKTSVRKMTISANLVSQPSGEVTVAQLHNQNAALPVLRISVSGNTIYHKVNKEPVKGTSLTNNGAFKTSLPADKSLEITLELIGDKYISATVNGEKKTFKIEDAWGASFDNAYYFKTGVYCQSAGTAKIVYNSLVWDK